MNIKELKEHCEKSLNNRNESVRQEHKLVLDILEENEKLKNHLNKIIEHKNENDKLYIYIGRADGYINRVNHGTPRVSENTRPKWKNI